MEVFMQKLSPEAFIDIIKSNLILIIIGGVDIIVLILMHFYIKKKRK